MDPRDRLPPFANGIDCAACGRFVPVDRIRVLARREALTFVELACQGCGSESLGIIVASDAADGGRRYGEFLDSDDARFREALPIGVEDVVAVRELLARQGLSALVGRSGDSPGTETNA
jgi:hypothetical protein